MKARNEFASDQEYRDYLTIYFAGQAMPGLLCLPHGPDEDPAKYTVEHIAEISVESAAALVKAVEKHIGERA